MHQGEEELIDEQLLGEFPRDLSTYLTNVKETILASDASRRSEVRTIDYTVTPYVSSKQDRLWVLKEKDQLTDAIFITADGHRESLHIDMLLSLEAQGMTPFYRLIKSADSKTKQAEYTVDGSLSADTLRTLIFFAYHGRCEVTPKSALALASCAVVYRLFSLLPLCVPFFWPGQGWVSFSDALKAFPLAQANPANQSAAQILQTFIEDHFEENWRAHSAELSELPFNALSCLLSSQRLHIRAESSVWLIIQNWTNARFAARLLYLPDLLKNSLRLGLLPESLLRDELLRSTLFLALSIKEKASLNRVFKYVLRLKSRMKANRSFAPSSAHFSPRDAKQLLVALGGFSMNGIHSLRSIEVFNYRLNRWSAAELRLPPGRYHFGLQYLAGCLFLFGDLSPPLARSLFCLDLSKPEGGWQAKAPMSEPRALMASVVLDGFLYVLGGLHQTSSSGVYTRTCERYDPKLDRWLPLADCIYPRNLSATVTVCQGAIYLAGEVTFRDRGETKQHTVEVYHPLTDTWSLVGTPKPSDCLSPILVTWQDRIWAIGNRDCYSYHPLTDTWRKEADLSCAPNRRYQGRPVTFEGTIYLAGGTVVYSNSTEVMLQMDKYDTDSKRWINTGANLLQRNSHFHLLSIPNVFPGLYRQ